MKKTLLIFALVFSVAFALTQIVQANWFTDLFFPQTEIGGTTLTVPRGGTGATSFTAGECVVGAGTAALTSQACGGGSGFPFSADTNYGVQVYSTSTPTLWFKSGLYASSTSYLANASSTQLTTTGSTYLATLDGLVGIGTTSPSAMLGVRGGGFFDGGTITASGFIATSTLTVQSTTATSTFSTGGLTVGTSQFVVQQSSGNVGIGTTGPGSKLEISQGSNQAQLALTNPDTAAITNTMPLVFKAKDDGGNSIEYAGIFGRSTAIVDAANQESGALTFHTKPLGSTSIDERMRITGDGNVGIGTTSPVWKLDVLGDIKSTGTIWATTQLLLGNVPSMGDTMVISYEAPEQISFTGSANSAVLDMSLLVGAGNQTFTFPDKSGTFVLAENASTTLFSAVYASSTSYYGAGLTTCTLGKVTWNAGVFGCGTDETGSGGAGTISTSTSPTIGNLAYWTSKDAWPETLGTVGTSTPTVTAPLAYSGTLGNFVGGAGGAFTCTTAASGVAGCLSSTAFDTFNNKQATISATYPIILTGATLSFPATSTLYGTGSYGQFLMWNGTPTWTATSTLTLGGDVTGTLSATVVGNDSHTHDATTISGLGPDDISALTVGDFASVNVSQWTNNVYYISSSTLTSAKIFVGNVSNVAAVVDMTGDITISNAGVTAIGATKVLDSMINFGTGATQVNTADVSELTNLYYTDARVNAYIHGSSTIPKTYTNNTFSGLQTFGNASTTLLTASYASSTEYQGAGLATCNLATDKLTWVGGRFGCGTDANTTYTGGDFLTLTGTDFDVDTGAIADGSTTILATSDAIYDFVRTATSTMAGTSNIITVGTLTSGSLGTGFTDVVVAQGGSGASTFTDHGVLIGSGTDPFTALTVGTNGQILVGSTGADPVFVSLNCSDALSCTEGAGTLEIDFDGGASPAGSLGGTWASPTIDDLFILNTGDIGTGSYTFPNASSTNFSSVYASSTAYYGAGLASCNGASNALTWNEGAFGCNSIVSSGSFPFAADTNYNVVVYSTSTPTLWFKSGLYASSTSILTYSSSTAVTVSGNAYFGGNVGIGTTTPPNLLSVSASVATSTPIVSIRNWMANDTRGDYSGLEMRFGYDQILIGINSGKSVTTGNGNTSLGDRSLEDLTTGYSNVAIGNIALTNLIGGYQNVGIGANSLVTLTSGDNNVGIGNYALTYSNGVGNTAIGNYAGQALTSGTYNVAIGYQALKNNEGGGYNTAIGSLAGEALTSGDSNIIIGKNIDLPSDTGSNQLNIGGVIFGTGVNVLADKAVSNGLIGIGTTSPYAKLSVVGEIVGLNFTATSTTATSTFPLLSSTNGAFTGLASCDTIDTDAGGYLKCGTDATGGGSFPFSADTNYGVTVYSTSTPTLWFKSGLYASSTSYLVNASSTLLTGTSLFSTNFYLGADGVLTSITGEGLINNAGTLTFDCSEVEGVGINCTGEDIVLDATGDWTGTIDTNNFAGGAIGAGELLYGSAASTISELAAGTSGYILMSGGTGAPSWVSTSTFILSSEIDTFAELDALVADKALVNKADGAVWLGVHDFGGATSLELPNGSPTIDTTGELGIDTTSGQLKWSYNGASLGIVMPFYTMSFNVSSSTWGAGTTTVYLGPAKAAITVVDAACQTSAGTLGVSLWDGTNRADYIKTASTTINTFTYSTNNTFTANEGIKVDVGTAATSPTAIGCRFKYTYTAD